MGQALSITAALLGHVTGWVDAATGGRKPLQGSSRRSPGRARGAGGVCAHDPVLVPQTGSHILQMLLLVLAVLMGMGGGPLLGAKVHYWGNKWRGAAWRLMPGGGWAMWDL